MSKILQIYSKMSEFNDWPDDSKEKERETNSHFNYI